MICYQQSFSTLNVNILVLHLISPFFGFTGFHQPTGWFRRKSLPKLADFSLSGAKGEILMYRTYRKIQNLDQNFSPKSRKCCIISPCLKALAWPLALVFFNKGRVIYYQLGGPVIFRGGRNFFLWCTGGVEKKMSYGQGGSCISSGIGGVRCVPLVFHFIKSHSFWGALPPRPPIDQLYNVILSEPLGWHWK